jgi:hypothetical protein
MFSLICKYDDGYDGGWSLLSTRSKFEMLWGFIAGFSERFRHRHPQSL